MLFAKLREEQIRKWRIREEELLKKDKEMPPKPPKKPKVYIRRGNIYINDSSYTIDWFP